MRKTIAKHISYPLQDLINGTSVLTTRDFLTESQFWPEDKMRSYQFDKFHRLLKHAWENIPFYQEFYKANKVHPSDIKQPGDIEKLPVLTKQMVRENLNEMLWDQYYKKNTVKIVTGGTTGPPLPVFSDTNDRSFAWGAFYRWYKWIGIEPGDAVTKIWGTPTVIKTPFFKRFRDQFKNFYYNRQVINSFKLNDRTIETVLNRIEKFKPLMIRGYLSALIQIANYMLKHDIRLNHIPKAISSTTETLFPPYKNLIERVFQTRLLDQYGCGECNSIAFELGDGNGLYIVMEHVLPEISGNKNEGNLIITNLDNYVMPFIRYENGDVARFGIKEKETEINLPVFEKILGRQADTITLKDGSKVHGVFFTDILNDLFKDQHQMSRFQAYQEEDGKLEFRIEQTVSQLKIDKDAFYIALKKFFTEVKIIVMNELPKDKNGKFRYILKSEKQK